MDVIYLLFLQKERGTRWTVGRGQGDCLQPSQFNLSLCDRFQR